MQWPLRAPLRKWLLSAMALGWLSLPAVADRAVVVAGAPATAPATAGTGPQADPRFALFAQRVRLAKRNFWAARMKKEIEEVAKVTGLDAAGIRALEAPAGQAVDLCLDGWAAVFEEFFRVQNDSRLEQFLQLPDERGVEIFAQAELVAGYTRPFAHPTWLAALQKTLSTEQAAAWARAQKENRRVTGAAISAFVTPLVELYFGNQRKEFLIKSAFIKGVLALPPDRTEKLDALVQTVARQNAREWGKRAEQILFLADESHRTQLISSGTLAIPAEERQIDANQTAWTEGLVALFSPAEFDRLELARKERRAKLLSIPGQILLIELDAKIAFTAQQRKLLEPLIQDLVQPQQQALFAASNSDTALNVNLQGLMRVGANAANTELAAILDPAQQVRWQELCNSKPEPFPLTDTSDPVADPSPDAATAAPALAEEDFENALSDFFYRKSTRERKRQLSVQLLQVEDATRAAHLPADLTSLLQTSTRGLTEARLVEWKAALEQVVRAQVRNAPQTELKQQLANLENFQPGQFNPVALLEQSSGRGNPLNALLTAEQRAAWQKSLDERNAYRAGVIASAILAEFDRRHLLSTAQWDRLHPLLARVTRLYGTAFATVFSNPRPWYLESYSMLVPFAAVPEIELNAILTREQWDAWLGSNEHNTATTYWQMIQQQQRQRGEP